MKTPKINDGGAAERAAESARQSALASQNIQKNFAADLSQENISSVVAGGSAGAADAMSPENTILKKKKQTNLSSALGLNT